MHLKEGREGEDLISKGIEFQAEIALQKSWMYDYQTWFNIWKWQGDDGWRNIECEWIQKDNGIVVMIDQMAAARKVP